jgi:Fe-S cluster biosynthesis and repair protein YggX
MESIKLNKKELFHVEGTNWKVGIELTTADFDSLDVMFIEAATRGVEFCYHAKPKEFKLGAYIQISLKKKTPYTRWVNSYTTLVNASMFNMSNKLKENFLKSQKVDISLEKVIV